MFDFHGTGPQQKSGNCNAPRAVTLSALIYCLRCMVGYDVPLNQVLYPCILYAKGKVIGCVLQRTLVATIVMYA